MTATDVTDSDQYRNVPVLTRGNFPKWEIQIMSFLTGTADHVPVIERRPDPSGTRRSCSPHRGRRANRVGRVRAGGPWCNHVHRIRRPPQVVLRHRKSASSVYALWTKISGLHRPADASLRHEAWLEFLSIRKSSDESYTEYSNRIESAFAKMERITPEGQTAAQCSEELSLFALLSSLPFDDHIRQALTTQSGLAFAKATEACIRFDTGRRIHMYDADSANAARTFSCWKCDSPTGASLPQLFARRGRQGPHHETHRRLSLQFWGPQCPKKTPPLYLAYCHYVLVCHEPVRRLPCRGISRGSYSLHHWCPFRDSGASSSMTGRRSAVGVLRLQTGPASGSAG